MSQDTVKRLFYIMILVVVAIIAYVTGIGVNDDGIPSWQHYAKVLELEEKIEEANKVTTWKVTNWLRNGDVSPQDMEYISWEISKPLSKWEDARNLDGWYSWNVDKLARDMKREIIRNPNCSSETIAKAARSGNAWPIFSYSVDSSRVDEVTREFLAFRHPDFGIRSTALREFKDSLPLGLVEKRLYTDLYPDITDTILRYYSLPERSYRWALDYIRQNPEYGEWIIGGLITGDSPQFVLNELAEMRIVEARRALAHSKKGTYEHRKRLVGDKNMEVVSALAFCEASEADILTKATGRLMKMPDPSRYPYGYALRSIAKHENSPQELKNRIIAFVEKNE
ncbi:MAG: hypothetical protein HQ539_01730 [Parcubacteria group bacterium]|nr:hypothetical protein [Parcubacteria group bacterium]